MSATAAPLPAIQVPGVYHRRVGDILVTALNDGHQDVAMTTVRDIDPEEAVRMLRAAYRPVPRRTAMNCFLVRYGARAALIDTGYGPGRRATVGHMPANLATAGVAAADIDTVLMTHMHPDHWGGLLDASGAPTFPNAELKVSAIEHAHWHDDAAMAKLPQPEQQKLFFLDARAHIAPYRSRTTLFLDGELFPGVRAVPLPGHTPGHTGMLIESAGQSLLVWGDIVHVPELQVPRPEVTMAVDVDPQQAVETRRRAFTLVADEGLAFAGMHLHFPALAHMTRHEDGFTLLPDAWCLEP